MELMDAIKNRRSIRKYKSADVTDEAIKFVLEAARWAPSWKNNQCWRFIVVRDSATKARLAGTLIKVQRGEKIVDNPSVEAVNSAPVLIVACAERGKSGYNIGQIATDKGEWFMFDVALAMQNLMLAAYSLGLGTVPLGLFDAIQAASILSLPDSSCVVAMTPLGYPEQSPVAGVRKELAEIAFGEAYGRPWSPSAAPTNIK